MKHLIIYNHLGDKVLDKEVFVDGVDFEWSAPKPVAYWLGRIILVEKEEVKESEPKTVCDTSGGDRGISEAEQPESLEVAPEADAVRDVTVGGEGDRQSTAPENTLGSRTKQRASKGRRGKINATDVEEV